MPEKRKEIATGKAKSVFETDNSKELILVFRDDTSAFDGAKTEKLAGKGAVNNAINSYLMSYLQDNGVNTHFIEQLSTQESLVRRLDMLPVEFVVRNQAAGSLCKRLGIEHGKVLDPPISELFLKDDPLGDPMINLSHVRTFGWGTEKDVEIGEALSLKVNGLLSALFKKAGIILVDYKLEFGLYDGELYLGDELSPDGCRLWDSETQDVLDKDRFRQEMGGVVESYAIVAKRLGIDIDAL